MDLLFASPITCEHLSVDKVLVVGDRDHHESAFYKLTVRESGSEWHDSENKTSKNYNRANFDLINTMLDVDCDVLFGGSDIVASLDKFYFNVNDVVDKYVPNIRTSLSTYPTWYTHKLKNLISEKKKLHSKWKALREFRLNYLSHVFNEHEELMYKIEFKRVEPNVLGYLVDYMDNMSSMSIVGFGTTSSLSGHL